MTDSRGEILSYIYIYIYSSSIQFSTIDMNLVKTQFYQHKLSYNFNHTLIDVFQDKEQISNGNKSTI